MQPCLHWRNSSVIIYLLSCRSFTVWHKNGNVQEYSHSSFSYNHSTKSLFTDHFTLQWAVNLRTAATESSQLVKLTRQILKNIFFVSKKNVVLYIYVYMYIFICNCIPIIFIYLFFLSELLLLKMKSAFSALLPQNWNLVCLDNTTGLYITIQAFNG